MSPRSKDYRRLSAMDVGGFAGNTYPMVPRETLQALMDFLGCWLLLDDAFEREMKQRIISAHEWTAYSRALAREDVAENGYARGFYLAVGRFEVLTGRRGWIDRFRQAMDEYFFDGVVPESQWVASGEIPDYEAYCRYRLPASGAFPVAELLLVAGDLDIPAELMESDECRRMMRLFALIVCLANDIVSFPRDREEGMLNAVGVVRRYEGVGVEEALSRVVDMHNEATVEFDRVLARLHVLHSEIPDFANTYLSSLQAWLHGAAAWQSSARRYETDLRVRLVNEIPFEERRLRADAGPFFG